MKTSSSFKNKVSQAGISAITVFVSCTLFCNHVLYSGDSAQPQNPKSISAVNLKLSGPDALVLGGQPFNYSGPITIKKPSAGASSLELNYTHIQIADGRDFALTARYASRVLPQAQLAKATDCSQPDHIVLRNNDATAELSAQRDKTPDVPVRTPASTQTPASPSTTTGPVTPSTPPATTEPKVDASGQITLPPVPSIPGSPTNLASVAADVADVSNRAERMEFLNAIQQQRVAVTDAARSDDRTVGQPYKNLPLSALGDYLSRAQTSLSQTAQALDQAKSGMDPSDIARFKNVYLNARDKAALGQAAIAQEDDRDKAMGQVTPFKGLLGPDANPLAGKSAALGEVFGGGDTNSPKGPTNDDLANRLVMLSGLPKEQQAATLKGLKLVERPTLTLADGTRTTIPILHNGYILGSGATGIDCSALVSAALPPDVRKGRFTTLDFRMMWIYQHDHAFPKPPSYKPDREKLVKETSEAFSPLSLYDGDMLGIGDLLVHRLPWEATGHVFVVRNYDPSRLRAQVLEASQSAGTVRERDFDLSLDDFDALNRDIRPGLFGLRLKPSKNKVCTYKDRGGHTDTSSLLQDRSASH